MVVHIFILELISTSIRQISWKEIIRSNEAQKEWELLKNKVLVVKLPTILMRKTWGNGSILLGMHRVFFTEQKINMDLYGKWKMDLITKEIYKQVANIC